MRFNFNNTVRLATKHAASKIPSVHYQSFGTERNPDSEFASRFSNLKQWSESSSAAPQYEPQSVSSSLPLQATEYQIYEYIAKIYGLVGACNLRVFFWHENASESDAKRSMRNMREFIEKRKILSMKNNKPKRKKPYDDMAVILINDGCSRMPAGFRFRGVIKQNSFGRKALELKKVDDDRKRGDDCYDFRGVTCAAPRSGTRISTPYTP
ncbi:hypothetical protein Nepgr_025659 [Nepenthes gracilis]|uniref:Uncharacterized protein n=1 Tax=Nepenthes gracilis TaxID=150966 RepID=A0AAD3T742_NEPGR|nr:hypothetical protein Nepgr_025659 [Nepenthes gracilis]